MGTQGGTIYLIVNLLCTIYPKNGLFMYNGKRLGTLLVVMVVPFNQITVNLCKNDRLEVQGSIHM